jgi:hypothetical protein
MLLTINTGAESVRDAGHKLSVWGRPWLARAVSDARAALIFMGGMVDQ